MDGNRLENSRLSLAVKRGLRRQSGQLWHRSGLSLPSLGADLHRPPLSLFWCHFLVCWSRRSVRNEINVVKQCCPLGECRKHKRTWHVAFTNHFTDSFSSLHFQRFETCDFSLNCKLKSIQRI